MATERLPAADFPGYASPAAIDRNKVRSEDRAVHEWYRFVLSFPPHRVQDYPRRLWISARLCVRPECSTDQNLDGF